MKIAVITGASSGLGKEYLRAVQEQLPNLDEIWILARRKDRLEALAKEARTTKIVPMETDLSVPDGYRAFAARLKEVTPEVALLVNNAGYGKLGDFYGADCDAQTGMVDLNNRALTAMTCLTLPYMKTGGLIIQIASIAAFVPTPRMSVYCATKSYVLSFSKALRAELKDRKINVLAVCPGPMDTEFLEVADIPGRSKTFAALPRVKAQDVAARSLKAGLRGKAVYTNRVLYKVYRVLGKFLPHNWLMGATTV